MATGDDDNREDDGISLPPLELEERHPTAPAPPQQRPVASPGTRPAPSASPAARTTGTMRAVPRDEAAPAPVAGEVSTAVADLLAEHHPLPNDATAPVRLDPRATGQLARAQPPRTLTAARGGEATAERGRARMSGRAVALGGAVLVLAAAVVVALLLDLPERLVGEPAPRAVLGPLGSDLDGDRFAAFSAAAEKLEEAVAKRKRAPATRGEAAMLLAASVVIHGGDRGRIARAEALLEGIQADGVAAPSAAARARAWVALARGRWNEAERLALGPAVPPGDRAMLSGWLALGRENPGRAAAAFTEAARVEPAPSPSRAAARYGLALAREAELGPAAAAAYRDVLALAPDHVGAALGLARTQKLSAPARAKLGEAVLGGAQAKDASRAEAAEAHALVAEALRESGGGAAAAPVLAKALAAQPAATSAAVVAGEILLGEGREGEALALFKATLAAPLHVPRTAAFRFARAGALADTGRIGEAQTELADLQTRLSEDPRGAFWSGRIAERKQPPDPAAAERSFRAALDRSKGFLPASLQLARLLVAGKRGTEALAVLRQAERNGAAPQSLRLALGEALLAAGQAAEAEKMFRQVVAAGPGSGPGSGPASAAARLGLAASLDARGNLEGARAELAILAERGDVPGLRPRLAETLLKLGRREEALGTYEKEIASGSATARTKAAAARLALELGKKDRAQALAEAAVEEDPRTPGALLLLAEVRRAAGDPTRALAELRRALALDGSPEVHLEYGRALAALGRDDDALAAFAEARGIPEATVERGRILLKRGDYEGAAAELRTATGKLPGNGDAFLLLGLTEERLGAPARAEAAWRTAMRVAQGSAGAGAGAGAGGEARYRLGRLEMERGQAAAALPHLRAAAARVAATDPWRVDLYFQLGVAERSRGTRPAAIAAFRRYLELAPPEAPARVEVTRKLEELAP
jgi:tetratricopeptide (TPR) repeat protein